MKNGKDQPLTVKTEKPAPETADRPKMAAQSPGPQAHAEPRRGKAERGVKRTMKNKLVDIPDSGVKGGPGGEGGDKPAVRGVEAALEPSAKRTVRPSKIVTKDPESQPIRDARPQSAANGKPALTPAVRDSQTSSNGDNRAHRRDNSQQQTTTEAASSRTAQVDLFSCFLGNCVCVRERERGVELILTHYCFR